MPERARRPEALAPCRVAAGSRPAPSKHAGSMRQPTRRMCCRRHWGHGRRQCPQDCLPRRAVTGAIPASLGRAAAAAERSRCSPKATSRREAQTGPAPGSAWTRGTIGRALRARRDGVIQGLHRLQGAPELVDQGLDAHGMGSDNARIRGQGDGRLDGVEARCDHVRRAHRVVAAAGCQRGASGELGGLEGRPAAQNVTENGGSFLLEPVEHLRAIVLQGAREAVGEPDGIGDDAAAVGDAWVERAPHGALRLAWRERIAMGEEQCELECGSRGVVCGPARGAGFARARPCQRMEGQEDQQVLRAQGGDQGPLWCVRGRQQWGGHCTACVACCATPRWPRACARA